MAVSTPTPKGIDPHDEKAKALLAEERMQSVLLRAETIRDNLPELSGFEDEHTRDLILAQRALRQSGMTTLAPLLPLLLRLKGKPYKLHNYFPFEPFFRTRMPKTTLLKTGRQVSKCFWKYSFVLRGDGKWVRAHTLSVGDFVMARSPEGVMRPQRISKIWDSGPKESSIIDTYAGPSMRVSKDHRVLVRDSDNHVEEFRPADELFHRDYVVTVDQAGKPTWSQVQCNFGTDRVDMMDVEVENDHTLVIGGHGGTEGGIVTHNSTSLAAQGVVFSNSIPYFSTLYVTPLFEMIRRFSHNYVRQFLEESPARRLFLGSKTMNSVLQRNFKNGAAMYFSYAFLDAERIRGIPADKNVIDEVQDMNYDFLQIIHETMSGSKWGLKQYAGTPKSLDNTIEKLWQDSSQAEWMIKCESQGCGHWNVPAADWDLMDMIGPWHPDISELCPGVVCSQCRKPLNPRKGRWVHRHPDRRWTVAGYHVPQIIMPMHYANHEKWDALIGKMQGRANTTPTTFLNEVCGESCDSGSKLITVTDIKAACVLPWKGVGQGAAQQAKKGIKKYIRRFLSVDWGGGGGTVKGSAGKTGEQKRDRTSYTTLAVLGMLPDGKIDVIWGHRSVRTHDWEYEAKLCLEAMKEFKCSHICHDYSGAGEGRLVLLYQSGLPPTNIINIRYQGFGHNIMNFHEATEDHPHDVYAVDKSRSLVTTCMAIKYGMIRFFQYDYVTADQPGLLEDFMALIEEKVDSRLGSDTYVIVRNPNKSDDFAHSVNMGACCLWWMTKKWPNIAEAAKFKISKETMKFLHPVAKVQWDDI
jgi:hypothetical protein